MAASTMASINNAWAECLNLAYSNWPNKYYTKQSDKTFEKCAIPLEKRGNRTLMKLYSTITVYDKQIKMKTHFGGSNTYLWFQEIKTWFANVSLKLVKIKRTAK